MACHQLPPMHGVTLGEEHCKPTGMTSAEMHLTLGHGGAGPAESSRPMQVAQVLLPGLLAIASSDNYGAGVRRKALAIAHSLAGALCSQQSPTDKETRRRLGALLEAWLGPICAILCEPISGQVDSPSASRTLPICAAAA